VLSKKVMAALPWETNAPSMSTTLSDARWPRQLIHGQALQILPNSRYSGSTVNAE